MNEIDLRMRLAALRQYLRDNQDRLSSEEIDDILDVITKIMEVLAVLSKK
ncbi:MULTISPECIES: hypothetical protein [Dyadobacter]|uniref:Uncharacterized protein n=1 Tax=Dyadobacter chenhuakuii TaxID=2909339 RepID=A0ABY4XRA9_9BACT|nr:MULTISPECIES: hypothetical protein [Dyadobacter]MCE7070508.1 hypothetical protein [Dyadobacter sp. CY327]MCF2492805.1 hypothetical protein [Dyadobacter chenhuakuii]USJ32905.1 hypothetical protein NFI80_09175 [Dyadobacter chenhuakuii]